MNKFQLRWLKDPETSIRVLQFREFYDSNTYAAMGAYPHPVAENWKWSPWYDVPEIVED